MTQHNDWDEGTNPGAPRTIAVVRRLADKANDHDVTLRDLAGLIGKVMGGLQALDAKVDGLDAKLSKRLDRIEDIARGAARSAETSSSDLDRFATETRRKLMLKNASLPTALVVVAIILVYGGLLIARVEVPTAIAGAAAVIFTAVAGILPALLGGAQPPAGKP